MNQGWIKLYRKLLEHPVFTSKDDKLFKTFIYCLLRANHKDTEVFFNRQLIPLKAGQFITGRKQAAKDLGYSSRTFDRKIQDLQKLEIMTRYMTHRFSIISIINWNTYQGKQAEDGPLPAPNVPPTRPELAPNLTTDKNDKNVKNPSEISAEISALLSRQFPKGSKERKLFSRVVDAIYSNREIAEARISLLTLLKECSKYPQSQVYQASNTFLRDTGQVGGKGEDYLLGILRSLGEPLPKKKGSLRSAPDSRVKEFIDSWYERFKEKFGSPYKVTGGKEGNLVKTLLQTYSLDRLKELAGVFFQSKDPFILKSGYTIGVFNTKINDLIVEETRKGKSW